MLSAFASAGIKSYQGILAVSALAAYLLVCFALAGIDLVRPPGSSIYLLLGVWLGGRFYDMYGNYDPIWWTGIVLGVAAAIIHWPIAEKPAAQLSSGTSTA